MSERMTWPSNSYLNLRDIAVIFVFIFFGLPLLIKFFFFINSMNNPGPENIEKGIEIIAETSIPWWIGIMNWLASIPGMAGAILIILFVWFLKWIGEVK
jgi:hypothetical protein